MGARNLEKDVNYFDSFIADWLGQIVTNPYDVPFTRGPNHYDDWETAMKQQVEEAKKAKRLEKEAEKLQEVYEKLTPIAKKEHFIEKKEDKYIISIPLPGVGKEEVKLTYVYEDKDGTSLLRVEVEEKDRGILAIKSYSQSFSFNKGTSDPYAIAAKCRNGYLIIEVPYRVPAKSLPQSETIKVL